MLCICARKKRLPQSGNSLQDIPLGCDTKPNILFERPFLRQPLRLTISSWAESGDISTIDIWHRGTRLPPAPGLPGKKDIRCGKQ